MGTAAMLFFLGAGRYNAAQLLGLKQIRGGTSDKGITDTGELDTSGVLSILRHPWYLATLLLIWARPLDLSAILVNGILTGYLIAGIYLEEKKLEREFGEQYRAYQKRVARFIPYQWLKSKITKVHGSPTGPLISALIHYEIKCPIIMPASISTPTAILV